MPYGWVAAATVVSGYMASESAEDAAHASVVAGERQAESADKGIDEARRQFDAAQALMKPYVEAGVGGLTGMQDLLGLNGPEAMKTALAGIESSPEFMSLLQQGEKGILANASATGGLRGGNTQAALGQFRPSLLSKLVGDRLDRLGGIAQLGQAAAAGQASAGIQTGQAVSNLFQQQGAAQAGGIIGAAQNRVQGTNAFGNSLSNLATLYLLNKKF